MSSLVSICLAFSSQHGRWILVFSLVVGLLSETLAYIVKPYIEILIALLLFTACLRVGVQQVLGALREIKESLIFTFALQLLLPLSLVLLFWLVGWHDPLSLALILLTAAPAISGSPHLVALLGFDPASTLRQLIVGTALLPLTIIPVFILLPELGSLSDILVTSLRLLTIILLAAGAAFVIRFRFFNHASKKTLQNIDGASTIIMAVVVLGLMAAIHSEINTAPMNLLKTLMFAISANFGLQIITTLVLARSRYAQYSVALGLIAGNRNISLFITTVALMKTQPLLLFVACYQIPMYLTPLVMGRFYDKIGPKS